MKATEKNFNAMLFIMLYKVVLTFGYEILKCDNSNEIYGAVLSCNAVYYVVQGCSNFLVLRTFARKSSNIDFFIKLSLQLVYELLVSEMQKNEGVTSRKEEQFFKIRVAFQIAYLRNEVGDPLIFLHFWHE